MGILNFDPKEHLLKKKLFTSIEYYTDKINLIAILNGVDKKKKYSI